MSHSHIPDLEHSLVADTACRIVYYSLECLFVVLVAYKAEISNHILYLLALIERETAEYTVRERTLAESLLKDARLCISAVQYRKVAVLQPLAPTQVGYLVCNNLALLKIGIGRIQSKRLALATVGKDRFPYLFLIP